MYNIVSQRGRYLVFSGIVIGLGLIAMIISLVQNGSPFLLGVDFRGGTRFEVQFDEAVTEQEIRDVFAANGLTSPAITTLVGTNLDNAWQIRTEFVESDLQEQILDQLDSDLAPIDRENASITSVSPAVGGEVTRAAFAAIVVAAIVILVYIMFVFRQVPDPFRYGACAVSAMIHDILVIFGFIAIAGMLLGWEVDALFLTAVLTVAGFSLQDTIVVFDRIRENLTSHPRESYDIIVGRSVLETIHRSLATQLAAMFIMVAILFFGGASIKPFIATLFVGMVSGTYSSIFHAVPLLVSWESWAEARQA